MDLKDGFYPALGTPLDDNGNFLAKSMCHQIELMTDAGASGHLVLGSMGQQPQVKNSDLLKVVDTCVEAVAGNAPVLVGCMDNSLARVKDRINALKDSKVDGVVLTTPFYYISPEADLLNFFKRICGFSPLPVYLYDLPYVTKNKITYSIVKTLMDIPNLAGIKSGDLILMRDLEKGGDKKDSFDLLFSGTELFEVAYGYGITKQLDGFYCCIPKLTKKLYSTLASGDREQSAKCMNDMNYIRNYCIAVGVFPAFTVGLNALGCEGNYHPDYYLPLSADVREKVLEKFREVGEI